MSSPRLMTRPASTFRYAFFADDALVKDAWLENGSSSQLLVGGEMRSRSRSTNQMVSNSSPFQRTWRTAINFSSEISELDQAVDAAVNAKSSDQSLMVPRMPVTLMLNLAGEVPHGLVCTA